MFVLWDFFRGFAMDPGLTLKQEQVLKSITDMVSTMSENDANLHEVESHVEFQKKVFNVANKTIESLLREAAQMVSSDSKSFVMFVITEMSRLILDEPNMVGVIHSRLPKEETMRRTVAVLTDGMDNDIRSRVWTEARKILSTLGINAGDDYFTTAQRTT